MGERWRRLMRVFAASVTMLALAPQVDVLVRLPEEMVMYAGAKVEIPASAAVSAGIENGENVIRDISRTEESGRKNILLSAGETGEADVRFRLLGVLPVGSMKVSVEPERRLVPGGHSIGVAMRTDGVVMVGSSDLGNTPSPARVAGLKAGDVIRSVNGISVSDAGAFSNLLSNGNTARLEVVREGKVLNREIKPEMDPRDGKWRLGAWVRDSTAGVGTLTFYDPENGAFGALGHAITDIDTGILMPVGEGAVYENSVVDIKPSLEGQPGELTGDFFCTDHAIGDVNVNSDQGIFGISDNALENPLYPDGLPIAGKGEVKPGKAALITTLSDGIMREYDCEITRIMDRNSDTRSMVIEITDEELLNQTGGIVQGMSGSPIIQDGKLIGAVTHVLVNDPARGYGIFIENMLEAVG